MITCRIYSQQRRYIQTLFNFSCLVSFAAANPVLETESVPPQTIESNWSPWVILVIMISVGVALLSVYYVAKKLATKWQKYADKRREIADEKFRQLVNSKRFKKKQPPARLSLFDSLEKTRREVMHIEEQAQRDKREPDLSITDQIV